jgi:tetratricopeptide (TPR) repeat protein
MRLVLIGLALTLAAPAAWAQTQQQHDWCYSPTATDDQTIDGCTGLIQAGHETPTNQAAAYDNRAYAYRHKGLVDQAIADETQALALNPNDANGYNNRGNAYDDKGLYDQAIADYTRAIGIEPDNAFAYFNRGDTYGKMGRRDAAANDYRAALRIDPTLQKARDALNRLGLAP